MAVFKAIQCHRVRQDVASRVAELPYDIYSRQEAVELSKKEPLSFIRIDRADSQMDDSVDTYEGKVYQKARQLLDEMIDEGYFIKDEEPCYYVYELTMDGRVQTGLVGGCSIDDYNNGVIKKHEKTLAIKEGDRIRHISGCMAQTGLIFMAYRGKEEISRMIAQAKEQDAWYDFTRPDGIRHRAWRISDPEQIAALEAAFAAVDSIYVCDGHHRLAAAANVGRVMREANPGYTGDEPYNYILSVLFPAEDLYIMPYNRVVADLGRHEKDEFFQLLSEHYDITECGTEGYAPVHKGQFGMYLDGLWYKLDAHEDILSDDPVKGLDVSLIHSSIIFPILRVIHPRRDPRIKYIGGIRGLPELIRIIGMGFRVAFSLYPTSIDELFEVADRGLLMPPKSTWFEPKLLSGLWIHRIVS